MFSDISKKNVESSYTNRYLFKVNDRNIRKGCEICSNLTLKTPERRQWLLITFSTVFIVDVEKGNICWVNVLNVLLDAFKVNK